MNTIQSFIAILFLFSSLLNASPEADSELKRLIENFVPEYKELKLPELVLSYEENLKNIQNSAGIAKQEGFYKKYGKQLSDIPRKYLSDESKIQYDYLNFEIELDNERIRLEKEFKKQAPSTIRNGGLSQLPNGKKWYEYYVKKWTSKEIKPTDLLEFGKKEVARVTKEMANIQKALGYENKPAEFYAHLNSDKFLITEQSKLEEGLLNTRTQIADNLSTIFEKTKIPLIAIKPIKDPNKDTPPGYYEDGTFYYNFYQNKFQARAMEWLFIHEAVPGHHYQGSVAPTSTSLQNLFWHPGFTEGWGAYAENLGKDVNVYQDPYSQYGKWEWDLVRSARVVLDVGINYLGWNQEKAKTFWKENIPNQDHLMHREVDRMFRWPAQVLSYKVGERTILNLRQNQKEKLGAKFDLKQFHTQILKRGTLPLKVLETVITNDSGSSNNI